MYIEPNSTVILLHGVPLDNKYEHTICWDDYTTAAGKEAQYNYFNNPARRLQILTKQTYQRYNRNYIKVAIPTDSLYNCDYMMFQNTSYGNKWFYAFVTNVSYVNGNGQTGTTLIEYEIDRMQTWYFDYELMQCFVEREHSATDEVGDNIIPENLETGDYSYYELANKSYTDFYAIITYIPNKDKFVWWDFQQDSGFFVAKSYIVYTNNEQFKPYSYSGNNQTTENYLECGLKIAIPLHTDGLGTTTHPTIGANLGSADSKFSRLSFALSEAECSVVSITLCPSELLQGILIEDYFLYNYDRNNLITPITTTPLPQLNETLTIRRASVFYGFEGTFYQPTNNKLYTYPYCGIEIRTTQNEVVKLDYLLGGNIKNGVLQLQIDGYILPNFHVSMYPLNYNEQSKNYNYMLSLNSFPDFSFSQDFYSRWWEVNKDSILLNILGSAIKNGSVVAGGALTSGGIGAIAGAIHGGANLLRDVFDNVSEISRARNGEDSYTKNNCAPNISYMNNDNSFYVYQMNLQPQFAKIIDDYFTRFGYATKQIKVPNRNVRHSFCYTKTIGCEIKGELPQEERKVICDNYDRGITFWKDPSQIGDFTVFNDPV